ncbi:tyrosine-type recombinase/integrase [Cupriavidus oxalaticus]|uniref:Integrase n=1 Tax=Cupriavidus oxalaticus TaxID=96344 RepID=A0A375GEX7_9BURK|nr:tyrosine-type recombinase/integrase [Cupriavidus oxalaticus]QRQ86299.1 tyrosine-type recombinase/integrase [Cupriavidus oxalaticus]QRQ95374.1 tyrosine-type recombinase/integrase [Cupriavidus oxalaticus]WQD84028.1 tyrosine-type recombinase/integrase [Cupriavidus oxalaticus]SPC17336.1 Integrase [Cupriavidus oxalaticus]
MIGRRKNASPLPSRVYEKNGAWYFVDIRRKWHKLCRVSDGLTALYTALASINRDRDERRMNTMPALVDAWLLAKLGSYAPKTQEEYRRMATFIRSEFDDQWLVEDVEPKDIARFLDKHFEAKPNASNKYRALLSVMFTFAVRKGLRNANPVTEVAGATEGKRDRYITDAELQAVRAAALLGNNNKPTPSGAPIVALIDLAYQTAQRIGDLLALNWSNVSDEGIMFHPAKTVNSSGVRMLIEMTPDLQATLDSAKAGKVKAIGPVICTQSGGRFTYSGAQTAWKRACQRARQRYEKSCAESGETPDPRHLVGMHFHDLRAKALTDLRRQAGAAAAQALAGHTTAEMTAHYTKAREIERVRPVRKHP